MGGPYANLCPPTGAGVRLFTATQRGTAMRIDIVNGHVVTGDGESYLEDTSVITQDGLITDLPKIRHIPYNIHSHRVLDAKGGLILPGLINIHAHAVCFGPLCPGLPRNGPPEDRILANLNNHLLQGTTTVLSLDGYALPFENDAINKLHPVNVKMATLHTPKNVIAGEAGTGQRIEENHRRFTAEEAVSSGAVAIGEVGSPATTGATYEKNLRLERPITVPDALALDDSFVSGDEEAFVQAMKQAGLEHMTVAEARKLVQETSIDTIKSANDAILETIEYAPRLGVPALCHAEPASHDAIRQVAKELGPQLVALHVNHLAAADEAVGLAKELKRSGAFVEVITADHFGAGQLEPGPESAFALLGEGLVDVLSTDYSGGYHDAVLLLIKKAIENELITLPQAVRLATSSPASIIPGLAANKGLIEPGQVADIIVVDKDDITNVTHVIIGGRIVVQNGRIVA